MAKKQIATCLFCDEVPCICDGAAKSSPKPKKKSFTVESKPSIEQSAKPSVFDSFTLSEASPSSSSSELFQETTTTRFTKLAKQEAIESQDIMELRAAMLNAESLMSPGSLEEHRSFMYPARPTRLLKQRNKLRSEDANEQGR